MKQRKSADWLSRREVRSTYRFVIFEILFIAIVIVMCFNLAIVQERYKAQKTSQTEEELINKSNLQAYFLKESLVESKNEEDASIIMVSILPSTEVNSLETTEAEEDLTEEVSTTEILVEETTEVKEKFIEDVAEKEILTEALSENLEVEVVLEPEYSGARLTKSASTVIGPSGKETYYNLQMTRVIESMSVFGYTQDDYWIREDGVKMLGDYVIIAANLEIRPKGTLVETSLGTGIVCDTGGFANTNMYQIDIAVTW